MKKSIVIVALLAGAASAYSQGQVNYTDYNPGLGGFNIHIWGVQPGNAEVTGNSAAGFGGTGTSTQDDPVGTTTYSGTPLGGSGSGPSAGTYANSTANGDDFSVELYAGAGTVASFSGLTAISSTITPIADGGFGSTYAGMYFPSGSGLITFGGPTGTPGVATIASGSPVTLALAAWYNGGGAYTSLAAAQAAGAPSGESTLGTENAGGGNVSPALLPGPGETGVSGGITSFSLATVPEPSTIALGVMGASAFLLRLRRKS